MSNFHRVIDRDRHGKPLPHFRIKYPSSEGIQYTHHRDRRGPNSPGCDYSKNPGWWNRLTTTRRRRIDDRQLLNSILRGADPEGIVWMPDKRPSEYYW